MEIEFLQEYLDETRELLEKAQADAMSLENADRKDELLASIFRAFHTIKGSANHVGVVNLVVWTHSLEDLLDKLRTGVLPATSERVEAILQGLDVIGRMVEEVSQQKDPAPGPAELGGRIRQLCGEDSPISSADVWPAAAEADLPADKTFHLKPADSGAPVVPLPPISARSVAVPPTRAAEGGKVDPRGLGNDSAASSGKAPTHARNEGAEKSIRIDAPRLDAVINQVGELVLLRNRLTSGVATLSDESENMTRIAREMDLTVNDLQNTVMRLRMQPCSRLFRQLPRVVHDVSKQLGKEVELEIVGEDVEIDKSIVDELSGPMTHLVRNSLDHGIEMPEVRRAANKPRAARLRVAAIHLGDRVRIEVGDDGKGIDGRFVVQKAIEKGVVTAEQGARLSEQESVELIFRPGFSTKDKASDLSGRGVGMDVVKDTTTRLRGRLSIDTSPGRGTRIAMEFPLSLAVLPVLYLRLREDTYALPVSSIDSLIDICEDRVHRLAGQATYRVDGTQTVPLVDLGAILQSKPMQMGSESVEGVFTERGIFLVSEVLGNEDSVVKPIDFLNGREWYQGATISGQGSVVLILDAGALSATPAAAAEGGF